MDSLENIVRTSDPDRYIAALFAPAQRRAHLFALYALNHELGHIAEVVRQPMMAEIRLQWWRDALVEARAGKPRGHEVLQGIAKAFAAAEIPQDALDAMIDARALDSGAQMFADMAALEAYADATSGNLMRIAARILGQPADDAAREAGIAYALTGILRAMPFHAARRKLFLPLDALKAEGLDPEDVFAAREIAKIERVFAIVADCARQHLAEVRKMKKPGKALPALMPATAVPFYLKRMTQRDFNPFRDRSDIPMYRRQLAMLAASFRGRP
ncbi:MAG TPA: phytoene/squalene synthase family protein [Rhizomicrobium sp.]|jgi:phytoene synthase